MYSFTTVSIAVCVGVYTLLKLRQIISDYRFSRRHGCKSTGPTRDFLAIRYMYDIASVASKKQLPLYGEQLYQRHNRLTFNPGRKTFITFDPRNMKAILSTQFKDFGLGSSREAMETLLGSGIFTQEGAAWSHSRALLRPSFTRTQIADFEALEEHTQELFETIDEMAVDGVVDMKQLIGDFAMDVSCDFLFGQSSRLLQHRRQRSPENESIAHWLERGLFHAIVSFNFGSFHWLWRPKEFRDACRFIQTYVDSFISRALAKHREPANGGKKYVFLDALIHAVQDPQVLRGQVTNVMMASKDTTATLLSWMIWNLARHPEIFHRLRSEIETTLGSQKPTWQELKDMKYLQAVIHETLRLYPPAVYLSRVANYDTTLPAGGGKDQNEPVFVPAGSFLLMSIFSMHRRTEVWGEGAEEYDPTWWIRDDTGKMLREIGWGYLPFGGGHRICPGQQWALTEASFVIVRLLQRYSVIERAPGEDDTAVYGASVPSGPADGVLVRLRKEVGLERE